MNATAITSAGSDVDLPSHLRRPRLKRPAASEYLAARWGIEIKPATLAKMVTCGGGPKYQKDGAIPLYPTVELDAWAERRLGPLRSSSSDKPK